MEENKQTQPQAAPPVMDIQPPRSVAQDKSAPTQEITEPVAAPEQTDAPSEENQANIPALAAKAPKQHSHKGSMFAVFCAVLVAAVFAALAVKVYMSDDSTQPTASSSSQQQATQANKAITSDVDSTNKAIDDNLSTLNDTNDYGDDAVSDTTLGL